MQYIARYASPLGPMLLAADDEGLTGAWFDGQRKFAKGLDKRHEEKLTPILSRTMEWLDVYFSGQAPDFTPPLHLRGDPFQLDVWRQLQQIPYGQYATCGDIADRINEAIHARRAARPVTPRGVRYAVGDNPVVLIVPCHRLVGVQGKVIGYNAGVDRKMALLELERADMSCYCIPRRIRDNDPVEPTPQPGDYCVPRRTGSGEGGTGA